MAAKWKNAAVIDIGSNSVKMKISQIKKGEIQTLDLLDCPVSLGHEVFHSGKISFETQKELSSILDGFTQVMTEYGVKQHKAVATSALREAENSAHVVDLIKIQNNISVEVLEDDQEKTLIYSQIFSLLSSAKIRPENALIAFIGTGSIGFAIYAEGKVRFSQNVSLGSLKLNDILGGVAERSPDFYIMVEEYLDSVFARVKKSFPDRPLKQLIVAGSDVERIASLLQTPPEDGIYFFSREAVDALYLDLRAQPPQKLSFDLNISEEEAEALYGSLAILSKLIRDLQVLQIVSPKVDLWDTILRNMLVPNDKAAYEENLAQNALACAQEIALHYSSDPDHIAYVRHAANELFDKMKKKHGLSPRKQLLLELSVILHECGHFLNSKEYLSSTYDLIRNTHIYGLSTEEMELVALTAKYNELDYPDATDFEFCSLSQKNQLVVSKLVAIFRLANAMDISRLQKFYNLRIRLEEDTLTVFCENNRDVQLEEWAFQSCQPYFEEVFGIQPVLTHRVKL